MYCVHTWRVSAVPSMLIQTGVRVTSSACCMTPHWPGATICAPPCHYIFCQHCSVCSWLILVNQTWFSFFTFFSSFACLYNAVVERLCLDFARQGWNCSIRHFQNSYKEKNTKYILVNSINLMWRFYCSQGEKIYSRLHTPNISQHVKTNGRTDKTKATQHYCWPPQQTESLEKNIHFLQPLVGCRSRDKNLKQ